MPVDYWLPSYSRAFNDSVLIPSVPDVVPLCRSILKGPTRSCNCKTDCDLMLSADQRNCANVPFTAVVGIEGIVKQSQANFENMTREALRNKVNFRKMVQYCQWVLAAAPGDPFFADLIARVANNHASNPQMDTLTKTGPGDPKTILEI